jgi:ACT domain-containing protein
MSYGLLFVIKKVKSPASKTDQNVMCVAHNTDKKKKLYTSKKAQLKNNISKRKKKIIYVNNLQTKPSLMT